jgi:hypothetical protein
MRDNSTMPMLMLRADTMRQVRASRPPGFRLTSEVIRLDTGLWLVPVTDDVSLQVAEERVRGECDDGVVSRLLQPSVAARQSRWL